MYTIPQKRTKINSEPQVIQHQLKTQLVINKVPNKLSSEFIKSKLAKLGKITSYRENQLRLSNIHMKKIYITINWLDNDISKLAYSIIQQKMTIKLVYDTLNFWVIQEVDLLPPSPIYM